MMKLTLLALIISIAGCAASPVWAHPAHGEGMGDAKKAILVVSFGTSVPGAEKNITSLVSVAREAFPDYEVRLAYTSDIIRRKLAKERNVVVPAPFEALAKLNDEGFKRVFVATTLMIPGAEYDNVKSVVGAFSGIEDKYGFEEIRLSKPLMATIPHCERMAEVLIKRFERELADKKRR